MFDCFYHRKEFFSRDAVITLLRRECFREIGNGAFDTVMDLREDGACSVIRCVGVEDVGALRVGVA
jgi:hypothetical protein